MLNQHQSCIEIGQSVTDPFCLKVNTIRIPPRCNLSGWYSYCIYFQTEGIGYRLTDLYTRLRWFVLDTVKPIDHRVGPICFSIG